jgi:hypothetical protein
MTKIVMEIFVLRCMEVDPSIQEPVLANVGKWSIRWIRFHTGWSNEPIDGNELALHCKFTRDVIRLVFTSIRMTLVNVRLDAEDTERMRVLRQIGVVLSTLVRQAIRAEYTKHAVAKNQTPSTMVCELLQSMPDIPATASQKIPLNDRKALRNHVLSKARRKAK